MNKLSWWGCYDGGWQAAPLVAEAYAHPAKISFGLAERIYRHMLAEGWLKPGDRVVDPFGGIGGCAFHAMLYGMDWTGVELEAKFVDLGNQNLDLWRKRYGPHFPNYGSARLLQGDSRRLAEIVAAADGCECEKCLGSGVDTECWTAQEYRFCKACDGTGRIGADAVISSPPYAETPLSDNQRKLSGNDSADVTTIKRKLHNVGSGNEETQYGSNPGQLGALPAGSFEAAVSSPPYAETFHGQSDQRTREEREAISGVKLGGGQINYDRTYGSTPGQLGALPAGSFAAAVSSPPYAGTTGHDGQSIRLDAAEDARRATEGTARRPGYGATHGQLEQMAPGDFAAAISSPPYSSNTVHDGNGIDPDKLTGNKPGRNSQALTMSGYSAAISSPPYSETRIDGHGDEGASGLRDADGNFLRGHEGWEQRKAMGQRYGETNGNLGNLPAGDFAAAVSSPPYAETMRPQACGIDFSKTEDNGKVRDMTREAGHALREVWAEQNYGETPGQLGAMKAGAFEAAVSSPPYAQSDPSASHAQGTSRTDPNSPNYRPVATRDWEEREQERAYGSTDGQLGAMKAGSFEGAVSSPPFEGTEASHAANKYADPEKVAAEMAEKYQDGTFSGHAASKEAILRGLLKANEQVYGDADGQLGTENGETFWTAAREIVAQVYSVLQPGGVAAWVTGDFVRNKKRVPFGEQWLALCESCGFELVAWATAWKTDDRGTQLGLLGDDKDLRKSKVSFFRRLANEKNPEAAILNEDVLFVRKPVRSA